MEKPSVGSVIDKGNIENIYKEARLKVIDDTKFENTAIDNTTKDPTNIDPKEEINEEIKEDKKQEEKVTLNEENKPKEEVYETMTMSDFFDEFKI